MKYIKKWKLFENHDDIHDTCKKYGITNYTINPDGSINVEDNYIEITRFSNVYLSNRGLTKLPLSFNRISGDFDCENNQLITLKGAPQEVVGYFSCGYNQLTNLEGAPQEVGGYFYCDDNELTSLEGAPQEVGGAFYCRNNQLTSLKGAPKEVGSGFYCNNNQLTSLDHLPNISGIIFIHNNPVYSIVGSWIENPEGRWEKLEYFQDLSIIRGNKIILPRLEEFHEVMDIPMPNLEEVKKYYKIIE
jgi:hypothetical protein